MKDEPTSDITLFLKAWNDGKEGAKEALLPFVYQELKKLARGFMSGERSNHTLQPTALVHEAFIKLSKQTGLEWRDSRHFFGISARLMRQILVDHARSKASAKRGSNAIHFSVDEIQIPVEERASAILVLDEVLVRLGNMNERHMKIVEMRFFAGMTFEEIADVLELSERTIRRDWRAARLWLYRELNRQ